MIANWTYFPAATAGVVKAFVEFHTTYTNSYMLHTHQQARTYSTFFHAYFGGTKIFLIFTCKQQFG